MLHQPDLCRCRKVVALRRASAKAVAFMVDEPPPYFFATVGMNIEIKIRFGIENSVKELQCGRTGDEGRSSRLQRSESERVREETGNEEVWIAVDMIASFESIDCIPEPPGNSLKIEERDG